MLHILAISLAISLVINAAMFLLAYWLQSDKLTDASYAVSFIALALFCLSRSDYSSPGLVGLSLIIVWALRIGSFLLYRVIKSGRDPRFDEMRESFVKFGRFWLGQALTVWILMIPATLAFTHKSKWGMLSIIGVVVWLIGFTTEAIADLQKYRFTHDPKHKNQWIESGLWRYSRHPNYFGEILVWIGMYIFALPSLTTLEAIVALVSPLFIATLLLFVSGIPILEKSADKRWGTSPAYRTYKKRTSLLVPFLRRS